MCMQCSEVGRSLLITKKKKKGLPTGGSDLFYPKSYLFCDLKLCAKFQKPRKTYSGRKECGGEKRKIIANIVDTLFCSNAQEQLTDSAQTPLGPKVGVKAKINRPFFFNLDNILKTDSATILCNCAASNHTNIPMLVSSPTFKKNSMSLLKRFIL